MAFVTWKHGANIARFHNNLPWRPQTKKSKRSFTVTGISCLDQARTANFGYRKCMKIYGQKSFESITDFNSIIEPDDVRAGLWLPTQYFTLTGSLIFSWVDKHVEQISFRHLFGSESHFPNIGSWKAGSPTSNPSWLKAYSRQVFVGLQQSHTATESTILRDQTLCFSAWDRCFSAAATKGWAWCKHNAELEECGAALRDLKLLVGSGDLDFIKGKFVCGKNLISAVRHPSHCG